MRARARAFAVGWALAVVACDPGSGGAVAPALRECPACECTCECTSDSTPKRGEDDGPAGGKASDDGSSRPGLTAAAGELGDLAASASRKMMHDDGPGCLDDLDRIAAIDPKMESRLAINRGQCEMLVGRCQEGKARIARWYESEMAMTPERAATMAEQLGSMRCRAGDSSDRDRLLRALFELNDGAYMNRRDAEWCAQRVATIRELLPKVPPRDADDTQISGGGQALFYTSAACFARAGDCKAAFATYRDLFPAAGLSAIKDPKQRETIVRESFESSVERCKGSP